MNYTHSSLIDFTKRRTDRRKNSDTSVQNRHIEQQSRSVIGNQFLKISDIKVGKRFRKDLGNIDELVESIKNNGLIVPVTIAKDRVLIAGVRRIEALKKLGIEDIQVHVLDIPIKENGEIDENLVRKDFTVEEKVAIKRYRESIEPSFQGQRNDLLELRGKFPQSDITQRRENSKIYWSELQNIIKTRGSSKSCTTKP